MKEASLGPVSVVIVGSHSEHGGIAVVDWQDIEFHDMKFGVASWATIPTCIFLTVS